MFYWLSWYWEKKKPHLTFILVPWQQLLQILTEAFHFCHQHMRNPPGTKLPVLKHITNIGKVTFLWNANIAVSLWEEEISDLPTVLNQFINFSHVISLCTFEYQGQSWIYNSVPSDLHFLAQGHQVLNSLHHKQQAFSTEFQLNAYQTISQKFNHDILLKEHGWLLIASFHFSTICHSNVLPT